VQLHSYYYDIFISNNQHDYDVSIVIFKCAYHLFLVSNNDMAYGSF
jgi:hypothetical protein